MILNGILPSFCFIQIPLNMTAVLIQVMAWNLQGAKLMLKRCNSIAEALEFYMSHANLLI